MLCLANPFPSFFHLFFAPVPFSKVESLWQHMLCLATYGKVPPRQHFKHALFAAELLVGLPNQSRQSGNICSLGVLWQARGAQAFW